MFRSFHFGLSPFRRILVCGCASNFATSPGGGWAGSGLNPASNPPALALSLIVHRRDRKSNRKQQKCFCNGTARLMTQASSGDASRAAAETSFRKKHFHKSQASSSCLHSPVQSRVSSASLPMCPFLQRWSSCLRLISGFCSFQSGVLCATDAARAITICPSRDITARGSEAWRSDTPRLHRTQVNKPDRRRRTRPHRRAAHVLREGSSRKDFRYDPPERK